MTSPLNAVSHQTMERATNQCHNHYFYQANQNTFKINTLSLIQKEEDRKRAWIWNFVPLQAWVLHVSCDVPTHPLPPCLGSGLVQVLIRVPPPHVLEHPLKGEKPPCTGTNTNETISSWVNTITKRLSKQPPNATITVSITSIRAPSKHTNTERRYKEARNKHRKRAWWVGVF